MAQLKVRPRDNPAGPGRVEPKTAEPRWPAVLALLATGGLHFVIPARLRFGQEWLLLVVVTLLLIPTVVAHRVGKQLLNRVLSHTVASVVTLSMVWSLGLLIVRLPRHIDPPGELLRAAAALWVINILVFASWYWRLDAGGPNTRDLQSTHEEGAFLFPQMITTWESDKNWRPGFVDYLFLAFNTSTAFSPTPFRCSRWAKLTMIVQALISLATVALLAARAVNIL
jgi:hypothetical protein